MGKRPAPKPKPASGRSPSRKESGSLLASAAASPAASAIEPLHLAPLPLTDLLGQPRAVSILTQAFASDRVHHAWIFHGPFGVGKFTAALAFASLLLDPAAKVSKGGAMATDGPSPVRDLLAAGTHPDLHVITKELARFAEDRKVREAKLSTIPKAVIDEHLLKPASLAPAIHVASRASKVFIVDEAELLDRSPTNAPTQNAILKTLEEPPDGTVIILVTSAEEQLLPTIRSRCQRVPFVPLDDAAMRAWLKRTSPDVPPAERDWLLAFAAGSPGAFQRARAGGLHAWHTRLAPLLARVTRGEYAVELAPTMAELVDHWADAWVKSHDNASKEAANHAGAEWMLRLLADHLRAQLRAATGDRLLRVADALDALRTAERRLHANLQGVFVYEGLVADLVAIFNHPAATA